MSISQKIPLSWRLKFARFVPGRNSGREVGDRRYRLALVLPPAKLQGWILDQFCREIANYAPEGDVIMVNSDDSVFPDADAYFFSHTGFFRDALLRHPWIGSRRNLVLFTHPEDKYGLNAKTTAAVLNRADVVVAMCEHFNPQLVRDGVRESLIEVATIGVDPELFRQHERGGGKVGLCSGYVPRKGGERILEIVRALPDRQFALCGRHWENWPRFNELTQLENFEYLQIPYSGHPEFYQSVDVFLTVSTLEGGPAPLIQAMMSNVVPVASRTGIAPEIITDGVNGYVFDTAAPVETIVDLIEKAFAITTDIRETVLHLTWQRFSEQIQQMAGIKNGAASSS